MHQRYLSDKPVSSRDQYIQAAAEYVSNVRSTGHSWLHCKPYQVAPGNPEFYVEMYQCLNLIQAMDIPYRGRILEVGSGPGWISEILIALGYEVHGLDPSAQMTEIARNRAKAALLHWQIDKPPAYEFYCESLEDCSLPSDHYDAILFHAALHHVIDEHAGLQQCHRLLRPGGVIGVCEGAWEPGNTALEAALDAEMIQYGTLENPFTREYLDHLLKRYGFINVQRYHSINGFIPESMGTMQVQKLAQVPARSSNNLTAQKPGSGLTTRNNNAKALTEAKIVVCCARYCADKSLLLVTIRLENKGDTTWLHSSPFAGQVTIAVRTAPLGACDFRELPRSALSADIKPGESMEIDLSLPASIDDLQQSWYVDLVAEECFWFSEERTLPARIQLS